MWDLEDIENGSENNLSTIEWFEWCINEEYDFVKIIDKVGD